MFRTDRNSWNIFVNFDPDTDTLKIFSILCYEHILCVLFEPDCFEENEEI